MQDQPLLFTLLTSKFRSLEDLVLLNSCVGVWMGKTTRMGGTPVATEPNSIITSKHTVIAGSLPQWTEHQWIFQVLGA